MFIEVTWAAQVGDGTVKVPGMRALAVGCGGNYQGGVKVIWAHSQVLSFQVGQPILNKAYISQSHCSRKEES